MTNIIELAKAAGAETQDGGKHWEFDDFDIAKFAELIRADQRDRLIDKIETANARKVVYLPECIDIIREKQ